MEPVIGFAEALAMVLNHARGLAEPRDGCGTRLSEARGEVLASALIAPRDQPAFDRSTRDGFAVLAEDVNAGRSMRLLGTVAAGATWPGFPLAPGEALEIMTGAPVPAGADAVLMVEHASVNQSMLQAAQGRTLRAGENIVPRGAEARAGDTLLPAGTRLDPAHVALAASCGARVLDTFARPTVAIMATGDELVEVDEFSEGEIALLPHQIFNSNTHLLGALVEATGGHASRFPVTRDDLRALRGHLASAAADADLLVLSGGVSMGKFDLVERALAEAGAEFFFTGVRIQPGKPVVFGRLPRKAAEGEAAWMYFFGLPGNPVSTEVCFHLFVTPLLRALCGEREGLGPRFGEATAAEAFLGRPGLVRFLPCTVDSDWRGVSVRPVPWQGSGDVAANARADGFCVVEEAGVAVGARARVLLR